MTTTDYEPPWEWSNKYREEQIRKNSVMVPVSDYYGVYQGDEGFTLMGVKNGRPYLLDIGWSYDEKKIDEYLEIV